MYAFVLCVLCVGPPMVVYKACLVVTLKAWLVSPMLPAIVVLLVQQEGAVGHV